MVESRRFGSLIVLMMMALLSLSILSGCNGPSGPDKEMNSQNQDTADRASAQINTAPAETPTSPQASPPQAPKDEATKQAPAPKVTETKTKTLRELIRTRPIEYAVEYQATIDKNTISMTIISDLPRLATITKTGDTETRGIFDGTNFYSCAKSQDKWQCFKMGMVKSDSDKLEEQVTTGTAKYTSLGTCSIAGETGGKYEIVAESGDKSTICYTSDGIMLEMKNALVSMTATKVWRTIGEGVFDLPAEAQELPAVTGLPQ